MTGEGSIEEAGRVNKDVVVGALRQMKADGMDAYETADPRAQAVQRQLDAWWAQIQADAKGDPAAEIRASVERNLILIEAGYDDREMLDSVDEWLGNDLEDAEKIKDGALAEEIKGKIAELEAKLKGMDSG